MVEAATLASQFGPEELEDLLSPVEHEYIPPNNANVVLSLSNFVSLLGHPQSAYDDVRKNTQRCIPGTELLTYYLVQQEARKLSGIVTWEHHMCIKSCVGFTGPYANLENCPQCHQPRYKQDELEKSGGERMVPRKVFTTFPVGPQLQARWKDPQTAKDMHYRWDRAEELRGERSASLGMAYDDIFCGEAYLKLVDEGMVGKHDTILMLSIDGAQLVKNKKSEYWLYIWIIADLAPDKRYKIRNILPGGVIPGPDAPWDMDSFLFPGLAHVSALQKEGLPIWDSYERMRTTSLIFLLSVLADTLAMASVSGSVGHHGRKGCRLFCGLKGRNKLQASHYFPALLKPRNFDDHPTSAHSDLDINNLPAPDPIRYKRALLHVIGSRSERDFEKRRFSTGIAKPSILSGIPRMLPLPTCFPGDLMHQPIINMAALLFDLWCARSDIRKHDPHSDWPWAVLRGDTWDAHGIVVAKAGKYLPTSFGRVPRNPRDKISSGYKAWEFLNYVYGLGPGVFYDVLPEPYYSHFCRLVRAARIIHQREISKEQLVVAHKLLLQWVIDFERLYYQRNPDRLHFVRPCVHSLTHLARETHRMGPLWLTSQWAMERVIGYLGSLVHQPSNMFRNLAAQAKRVAYANALIAMWPDLQEIVAEPQGSINLGDGYVLLGPKDTSPHQLPPGEHTALETFFSDYPDAEDVDIRTIYRSGRLKISNEQIARSRWKEMERCTDMARTDRNVKVRYPIQPKDLPVVA
jgi:hypothetical protein